jgi:autophagy-related protein 11
MRPNRTFADTIAATPPFRPSQLATSYLRTAHVHQEHINNTLVNLRYQHEALRIASNSLDLNVLAIVDAFEGIASGAQKELEKQELLLAGVDADLEIISRVRIHAEFMSPAVRKAMEAGEKARTLVDYVSNGKMRQVAETCARTHGDLRARFTQVEESISHLNKGTESVRVTVSNTKFVG